LASTKYLTISHASGEMYGEMKLNKQFKKHISALIICRIYPVRLALSNRLACKSNRINTVNIITLKNSSRHFLTSATNFSLVENGTLNLRLCICTFSSAGEMYHRVVAERNKQVDNCNWKRMFMSIIGVAEETRR
jgi:hypothetical protein